jgi:hypothetical protein
MPGEHVGHRYNDSDVFKVIEGAAYALSTRADPELDRYLDGLISKIAAAQEDDGYLFTTRTIDPDHPASASGATRWSYIDHSHELYNVGHMYEAAVAYAQATGKRTLLDVATRNADLIEREFGPGRRSDPPGHEEIEIGLVKLYRVTGGDLRPGSRADRRARRAGRPCRAGDVPVQRHGGRGGPHRRCRLSRRPRPHLGRDGAQQAVPDGRHRRAPER